MKKTVVIVVLLVFVSLGLFALKPRDCVNCGSNCCAGSCDVSSSCSQCFIYDCLKGGQYQTLDCGMGCPD